VAELHDRRLVLEVGSDGTRLQEAAPRPLP
jgi:hypothetical protein